MPVMVIAAGFVHTVQGRMPPLIETLPVAVSLEIMVLQFWVPMYQLHACSLTIIVPSIS